MADNKKYYYLKVKENFYDSDSIIILESMENGYLYSNILMKLYLRSLKGEGRLMFNDKIPFNAQMLSKVVRHNVDVVEKAIRIFKELDLIEVLDNGAIYMLDIQNYIGESSTEADRKREYRAKIQTEIKMIGQTSDKCPDISPPEIEKKKEIKKEKEKELNTEIEGEIIYSPAEQDYIPYKEIIEYLNEKIGSNYKPNASKTKTAIHARIQEGYTLEDFKIVIDKKYNEWYGTDMAKYLRPETLFGTKFEGYLNQPETERVFTTKDIENKMDWSDMIYD